MKTQLRIISAAVAIVATLASTAVFATGTLLTTMPPVPVTVTNTPSVNISGTVPVTGSVSVANPVTVQGSVNATISGGTVTATLPSGVTIANPPTSPVFTSNVNDPARTPYQAQQSPICTAASAFQQCTSNFASVPAGKRLVIQNVAWLGVGYPAATSALLIVSHSAQSLFKFVPFATYPYFGESIFQVDSNMTFTVDSGALTVTVDLYSTTTLDQSYPIALTGYLIDCTIGSCAPIVTQ